MKRSNCTSGSWFYSAAVNTLVGVVCVNISWVEQMGRSVWVHTQILEKRQIGWNIFMVSKQQKLMPLLSVCNSSGVVGR
jgi:hypothetical protein